MALEAWVNDIMGEDAGRPLSGPAEEEEEEEVGEMKEMVMGYLEEVKE